MLRSRQRVLSCLITLVAVSAIPVIARSQTVDTPCALVVYFDEGATVRSWYGTGPVAAYVVAGPMVYWDGTHEVPYQALERWSGQISLAPMSNLASAVVTPRGGVAPVVIDPVLGVASLDVTLAPALPLDGRTVVADLALDVLSQAPTQIRLWGMSYRADGQESWFSMLTSGPDGPMDLTDWVANINAPAPIAVTPQSWGAVKQLFR